MMVLYSGTTCPFSHRCRFVLFEKGMDFEIRDVDLYNKTEDINVMNPYGQVPILVDGSFRYGADILKALALGAKGVLIGRPILWGLTAYGADGVQGVVELLQTDLARIMAMCGRVNLAEVNDSLVRIHAPLPAVKHNG